MRKPKAWRGVALSGVVLSTGACAHVALPNAASEPVATASSESFIRVDHVVRDELSQPTVQLREAGLGLPRPSSQRWVVRTAGMCTGLGVSNSDCTAFLDEFARALLERGQQVLSDEAYRAEQAAQSAAAAAASEASPHPSEQVAPVSPTGVDGILVIEGVHDELGEPEERFAALHYYDSDATGNAHGQARLPSGTQSQLAEVVHMRAGAPGCVQRSHVTIEISVASPDGPQLARLSAALSAPTAAEEVSSFLFRVRGDFSEPTLPIQRPLKQTGTGSARSSDRCTAVELAARGEALGSIAKSLAERVAKGGSTP